MDGRGVWSSRVSGPGVCRHAGQAGDGVFRPSQDAVSAEEAAEASTTGSTDADPRAHELAGQATVPFVDRAESAEERAAIIQHQNEAYAVAEAADRARQERDARENATPSSPHAHEGPGEEADLNAVRRARIARFGAR